MNRLMYFEYKLGTKIAIDLTKILMRNCKQDPNHIRLNYEEIREIPTDYNHTVITITVN